MTGWLKGSLLLVTVFGAGIAIGVTFERMHSGHFASLSASTPFVEAEVMAEMDKALTLDSAQHHAIVNTLHRHQRVIDSAWGALHPHINATLDSVHEEVLGVLRPEQRSAFLQMIRHGHQGLHKNRD